MDSPGSKRLPAVAVIGTGYWGKNLVRNYRGLGALKLICDKNETLLDGFKHQYPGVDGCLALSDALSREEIDGVVIATPAETHFALAREALLARKHVCVEKPLALSQAEAEELIGLARERRRILMVGHLLQYHPIFVRLKELAVGGELGRINYIYSHRLNLGKIRREENILWSFAPHDISMILALAAEEPESVMATGGNYLHRKIADVTTTHLEFPSGLRAHIFVSWLHPSKEQKLVVVGDKKMAVFDDTKPWPDKLLLYPHEIRWKNNVPVPARASPERLDIAEAEPLRVECEHFLQCIVTGQTPRTDGHEGLKVLKILKAGQRSLDEEGRKMWIGADADGLSGQAQEASRGQAAVRPSRAYFVHPTAVIDEDVAIGDGTKIWHFTHILSGSRIGKRCVIGQNVAIGPDVTIGDGCKIQNNVSLYKGVTLEDEVFCGPSCVFTNVYNPRAFIERKDEFRPTLVKRGATIGANVTIVCGVTIGEYAMLGAGSVVKSDVLQYAVVAGVPARQVGWACRCGTTLAFDDESGVCDYCGNEYALGEGGILVTKVGQ